MFSPFKRIAPTIWALEDPPGQRRALFGFGVDSDEILGSILRLSGQTVDEWFSRDQVDIVLLRPMKVESNPPTLPGVQLQPAPPMTNLDLLCQRPQGHEGDCGRFSEADIGHQVNESGQLIPTCLKPLP